MIETQPFAVVALVFAVMGAAWSLWATWFWPVGQPGAMADANLPLPPGDFLWRIRWRRCGGSTAGAARWATTAQNSNTTSSSTIDHDTTAMMKTPVTMPTVRPAGIETQPSSTTYSVPPLHLLGGGLP